MRAIVSVWMVVFEVSFSSCKENPLLDKSQDCNGSLGNKRRNSVWNFCWWGIFNFIFSPPHTGSLRPDGLSCFRELSKDFFSSAVTSEGIGHIWGVYLHIKTVKISGTRFHEFVLNWSKSYWVPKDLDIWLMYILHCASLWIIVILTLRIN